MRRTPRPFRAAALALLLAWAADPASAGEPRRVLVLSADPGASRGLAEFNLGLHRSLNSAFSPEEIEVFDEPLDLVWATAPEYRARLAAVIEAKYLDRRPDVVLTIGIQALRFAVAERQTLFPGTPLLFAHVRRDDLAGLDLPPEVAGVTGRWAFDAELEQALHLLPGTERAVVVLGSGPVERSIEPRLRRDFERFAGRVEIDWWIGVPMPHLERRIALLPRGTVVVYIGIYRDDSGASHIPVDALERLVSLASVPVFSQNAHHVGLGVVGSGQYDLELHGERVGAASARLLRGERPASLGVVEQPPAPPRFDARQLARWRIPRRRLPEGSRVEFETSIWRQHRLWILAAGALFAFQSMLIAIVVGERSRRARAERAERRMRQLYSGVFQSLHDRVAILDHGGRIVAANRAWSDRAQADGEGTAVGESYLEAARRAVAAGREDARRIVDCIEAVLAGRQAHCRLEYAVVRDGDESWYEMDVVSFAGDERGAVVAISDVTERRTAENRLRLALESLPVATVLVGSEGGIEMANGEAERLFGYAAKELLGRPVEILVPPGARRGLRGLRAEYLEKPDARAAAPGLEMTGLRKDGGEVPVEVRLRPIRIGARTLALTSVLDLSERQRLEGEMLRLRAEAAHFGRLASAGELSAAIAHELNQPLTGILTNAEAAQRFLDSGGLSAADLAEVLADIAADGRRAGEVIRRLRTLLSKGPIELRPLDVNETVEQVVRLVSADVRLRGSALDLELATGLPQVQGDRIHLQQVVLNLILNGIDAMAGSPPERRRLLLRTSRGAGRAVELEVRDAGTGIPPETMPRLFEPFFTTKKEGMGMGLSIVRSIVQSHGGTIEAAANPSGGATFTVRLPAIAAAEDAA